MKNKIWINIFLNTIGTLIIVTIIFNIFINPLGVFPIENSFNKIKNHTILRITKFYYCKRLNPDLIIAGTSRVHNIPIKYLTSHEQNTTVYNMGIPGSSIDEQYYVLHYFINNSNVKKIILGIDFFSYNNQYAKNNKNFQKERFYSASKDYLTAALSYFSLSSSFKTLLDNLKFNTIEKENYFTGDTHLLKYQNMNNQRRKEQFMKTLKVYKTSDKLYNDKNFNKQSVNNKIIFLQKIITDCDNKNIDLKIFINPINSQLLDIIYEKKLIDLYSYWLLKVNGLTKYYNFSGYNSITCNQNNFLDPAHYKPIIGKLIFSRIYNKNIYGLPSDFGIMIPINSLKKKSINIGCKCINKNLL